MHKDPSYPAMKWHPETAESRVFHKSEDVPEGWLDEHPSNVPKEVAKPTPKVAVTAAPKPVKAAEVKSAEPTSLPMTREEMKAELQAGGIPFAPNAKDQTLYDALKKGVQEFLTGAGVAFPPDADVPALIALAKQPPVPADAQQNE